MNRICLISNYNLYESKRYFTVKLAEALQRKGIETQLIDVEGSMITSEILNKIVRFNPNLTCSFNTLLPLNPDIFLWDFLEIPHWFILLDPAIYSLDLMKSPYLYVSCVDQEDFEMLQAQGFSNSFFFPHAVEKELIGSGYQEKIYDVVFLGSCYDYESLQALWQREYPEEINQLILMAAKSVLSDPSTSISKALYQAWKTLNISPEIIDLQTLFYYVDRYSRGKDRIELIKSIRDAEVHVFGSAAEDEVISRHSWDYYLVDCKNVILHPAVNFQEGLEVLKQSKISLSSAPFFKKGSHERVFTALSCGALPFANATIYWQTQFIEDKELVFYHPEEGEKINAKINTILANEPMRREMVSRGSLKVQARHTWDQRVDMLQTWWDKNF